MQITQERFTPGPHIVEGDDEKGGCFVCEPSGSALTWCDKRADAYLFAAAPELYEALAEFIASADAGHVSVETDRKARAALAKARGEQA